MGKREDLNSTEDGHGEIPVIITRCILRSIGAHGEHASSPRISGGNWMARSLRSSLGHEISLPVYEGSKLFVGHVSKASMYRRFWSRGEI